jgi:hypothetical protein
MTAPTSTRIPGYVVGTWDIDPVHSMSPSPCVT